MPLPDRSRLPDWPASMSEDLAAAYLDISGPTLRRLSGRPDGPRSVAISPGRRVWLRRDLDAHLDRLAGHATASAQADQWND